MIVNRTGLLRAAPIKNMLYEKVQGDLTSYGLVEAGYDIRIRQAIILTPENRFSLASAIEEFQMPDDLVGIVHDKSTWARQGLSVFNTVIEPKFMGGLTLELVYHGNDRLEIPAGVGIAQVIFHGLTEKASYNGRYQHQSTDPTPSRF